MKQDYAEAMKWYRKAADADCSEAVCRIGDMYLKGLGMQADPGVAARLYVKAAEHGSWEAEIKAADLMSDEKSPAHDKKKALELYMAAAAHANVYAEYRIGCLLEKEDGLEKQMEGFNWIQMAAKNGYKDAQQKLLVLGFSA